MAYNQFGFHVMSIPPNFKLARYSLPNSMPELNQLLSALFLLSLVLYLAPVVFRLDLFAKPRRWFQRAASLSRRDPYQKVMGWLLPRIDRS
jgi:hypothetical protein